MGSSREVFAVFGMSKSVLFVAGAGVLLAVLVILAIRGTAEQQQVPLSDGRLLTIEAVTFGTNHVVGWNDWWLVPLRKILPNSVVQILTPTKGQSRQSTDRPALVVWVHARDATGKYVDCQGVRASFIDEQGDVYPANTAAHGAFANGFNREAHIFYVFPRRSALLKLQLSPFRSVAASTVLIPNPGRNNVALNWTAEAIPATRRVDDIDFTLASLAIHTNGGPRDWWSPQSLHWEPAFRVEQSGTNATSWELPEWGAEDVTGNRGKTLGLHERLQRLRATAYPKPDAVTANARRWQLPLVRLPATTAGVQWNSNRLVRDFSITVIGLFPAGSYTFSDGQLTNLPGRVSSMNGWTGMGRQVFPGRWQWWSTHGATNYTAFVRLPPRGTDQRVAVGLTYKEGEKGLRTTWGRSDAGNGVTAFVFTGLPGEVQQVQMEVVLLEALHAEFVVRPPLEQLARP